MRRCILEPIPEFDLAAKLLDAAADALLNDYRDLARTLLFEADNPRIIEHAIRMIGPMTEEVHRRVRRPGTIPKTDRDPTRMPPSKVQTGIFERDGWRCRFCGIKVISRTARNNLISIFPEETHWDAGEYQRHTALYAMAVSLDHVIPHGRGGSNQESNFVTACYCCQFGRGEWTLEEMDLLDPRHTSPIVDDWDGLSRIDNYRPTAT